MMISTISIPTFLLSFLMVRYSVGMPETPIIDPLFCALCKWTTIPFPCVSRGLEFAVQAHNFVFDDDTFTKIDISHFQKTTPIQTGYTKSIGWVATDPTVHYAIYGGEKISAEYKAVNHRAYFLPPTTGTYKLSAKTFDDVLFVWVGDNAYSGKYTRENADLVVLLQKDKKFLEFQGVANTPKAIRILFLNAYGAANFQISMTNPDGTVFFDANTVAETPFFIPFTCDGTSPAFWAWGKETE